MTQKPKLHVYGDLPSKHRVKCRKETKRKINIYGNTQLSTESSAIFVIYFNT